MYPDATGAAERAGVVFAGPFASRGGKTVMFFPIVMKFAVALGVFWLISPTGKLLTAPRYGRRVAACFLVVLIVAYPFTTYSAMEWRVALFMAPFAWGTGFVLGWLAGMIAVRRKIPTGS